MIPGYKDTRIQEVKLRKLYCYEPGTYTKALRVRPITKLTNHMLRSRFRTEKGF
jgi:hypothetical protein